MHVRVECELYREQCTIINTNRRQILSSLEDLYGKLNHEKRAGDSEVRAPRDSHTLFVILFFFVEAKCHQIHNDFDRQQLVEFWNL